jgi:hypothetical protein
MVLMVTVISMMWYWGSTKVPMWPRRMELR